MAHSYALNLNIALPNSKIEQQCLVARKANTLSLSLRLLLDNNVGISKDVRLLLTAQCNEPRLLLSII